MSASKRKRPYGVRPPKEVLERLILEEGKTVEEIAKMFGVTRSTVYKWIREYNIPYDDSRVKIKPSPELAYVLGVLYGDGCVYRGKCYAIILKTKDKPFAETWAG